MGLKKRASKPKAESTSASPRRKDAELRKDESMRIRISQNDKGILEKAAARVGQSVSAYVIYAALEKARNDLGS